ncbi:hypothetical protein Pmani_006562 [Petrolisthes manimaculis]|uniref:Uncharacterized protein n=1 Tax=Petrolisthes manimaculis TaxID=1843537 RepID=A0AAE1QAB2_9EUCA|nr:hypothetical protein Pmani_006562 [Petrolisthes manimaculis]
MVILMGVREEELIQKLISLDSHSSLDDMVTVCQSYEAARRTTSAIRAPPEQVRAISTYVKNKKGRGSNQSFNSTSSKCSVNTVCECRTGQHPPQQCPAAQSMCNNCGEQGHRAYTRKCPAVDKECRHCHMIRHFDKCCKKKKKGQTSQQETGKEVPQKKGKQKSQCRRLHNVQKTPQTICVQICYGDGSTSLHMLPETGADVSVIRRQHLERLGIPLNFSIRPQPQL